MRSRSSNRRSTRAPRGRPALPISGLASLLLVLSSCASSYDALRRVDEIPDLAPLAAAADAMPRTLVRRVVSRQHGDDVRMAFEEIGAGDRTQLVVLVHGVLSDRRMWRFVVGDLGADHDLILVDLPGSGDSDRPDPAEVGDSFYSPDSLARWTLEGLRDSLRGRERQPSVTLVGHSLGGMVVLRMFANPSLRQEYADVLSYVDRLVLFAPLDVLVERQYPEFKRVAEVSDFAISIAVPLGILREECARATLESAAEPWRRPRCEADRLIDILSHFDSLHAHQAMLRQAIPFLENGHPDFDRIQALELDYGNVDLPTLILWGARDENLSACMGYKLRQQLDQSWLRILPTCSHALASERPRLCAAHVREFARRGGNLTADRVGRVDDRLPEQDAVDRLVQSWMTAGMPARALAEDKRPRP